MPDVGIRLARPEDLDRVKQIVTEAYTPYIDRIGKKPGPMNDDYAGVITKGLCHVATAPEVCGIIVLVPKNGDLLLDNIAVSQDFRGKGVGRSLLDFAEQHARASGHPKITLYTHVLMAENQNLYLARGYLETHRVNEDGFDRVYMSKALR